MFTGIVEEVGRLRKFESRDGGRRLTVEARLAREDLAMGDSIAIDGCCLTAVGDSAEGIQFDVLGQTVRVTRLASLREGDPVNLERSLRYHGKVGGHFVSGHVDTTGEVTEFTGHGSDHYLRVSVPPEFLRFLIPKGSVAVNGVSLTVAELDASGFAVWLIPHTLEHTNLGSLRQGAMVNLEFDLLGKYVERIFPGQRTAERTPASA